MGSKILILPKFHQICPNLIAFAQISPQFCPKFAQIQSNVSKFNQFCPNLGDARDNTIGAGDAATYPASPLAPTLSHIRSI